MVNSATSNALLISVLGTAVFVCFIYFCYAYLRPHLKKPKNRVDSPIPQWHSWQVRPDPRLRDSLYSLPAPDYLHPRHARTDNEMRSTRWSTNVYDLSRPSSRVSSFKHARQFSLQCNLPPAPSLIDLPSSRHNSMVSERTPNGTLKKRNTMSDLASVAKQNEQAGRKVIRSTLNMSDLLALANDPTIPRTRRSLRYRSRSDSQVHTRRSILAQTQAALTEGESEVHLYDPRSPKTAALSETTLPLINKRKSLTRHSSYASFAQAAIDANSSGPSSASGDTTRTPPPPLPALPPLLVQGAQKTSDGVFEIVRD